MAAAETHSRLPTGLLGNLLQVRQPHLVGVTGCEGGLESLMGRESLASQDFEKTLGTR